MLRFWIILKKNGNEVMKIFGFHRPPPEDADKFLASGREGAIKSQLLYFGFVALAAQS